MKGPLYRTLAAGLRERIAQGEFPPGAALPTEYELCAVYGVSRHTARDALRLLQEAGLIERRRGAGTIVRAGAGGRFVQTLDGVEGLLQYARNARLEAVRLGPAVQGDPTAKLLGLAAPQTWTRIDGVRRTDAASPPLASTTIFVRADLCPTEADFACLTGALNGWIAERHGVKAVRVEQEIAAVALDAASAESLQAEPAAPALRTLRRYFTDTDDLFQASLSLHPGDRFSYAMMLERTS